MAKPTQAIKDTVEKLRDEIRYHDQKYYVEAANEISDLEYDKLFKKLTDLEEKYPELVTADSPTQRVGEQPVSHLEQVEHTVPMLSIDNTYSIEELSDFGKKTDQLLDDDSSEWVVELKIDGVAATLVYEKGVFVRGLTRGNGKVGDDITHNLRTVADIPLKLKTKNPPKLLEVRGEVYMTNADLVKLNERQEAKGEPTYANTRNVTAGSVRLLDPRICAERNLRMFCHGTGLCEGVKSKNHMDFLKEIGDYGLPPTPLVKSFKTFAGAVEHCQEVIEHLHDLDFECDGLVLKLNNFDQRDELGARSKSPRWVVAYKWEKYEAVTKLNEITIQVGKTGALTPVAELEPVELAGTTVSRASLHNAEEIERKDIREGDTVVVEKAGKIIPHIVRVEAHLREGNPPKYKFPTTCPKCETKVAKDQGGVYIRCQNEKCPAQIKHQIRYFASRNAMDIEGLGDKLVDQLVSDGIVSNCADLYRISKDDLVNLERMGTRSADKLLNGIEASKSRGLARLLNALPIQHVGTTVASIIANYFASIEKLNAASVEEISGVDQVGETIAESVHEFLHSESGSQLVSDLEYLGLKMDQDVEQAAGDSLAGKTFVVTGTLVKFKRDQIKELIKSHGGKASSSVSKSTDFLVAGEKAGSKLAKAESLGVKVISEEEFESLIQ